MTRNEYIIEKIREFTESKLAEGPQACRDYLIKLGIYDDNGKLTKEYGGND